MSCIQFEHFPFIKNGLLLALTPDKEKMSIKHWKITQISKFNSVLIFHSKILTWSRLFSCAWSNPYIYLKTRFVYCACSNCLLQVYFQPTRILEISKIEYEWDIAKVLKSKNDITNETTLVIESAQKQCYKLYFPYLRIVLS